MSEQLGMALSLGAVPFIAVSWTAITLGILFVLVFYLLRTLFWIVGQGPSPLAPVEWKWPGFTDTQVRWFVSVWLGSSLAAGLGLVLSEG